MNAVAIIMQQSRLLGPHEAAISGSGPGWALELGPIAP